MICDWLVSSSIMAMMTKADKRKATKCVLLWSVLEVKVRFKLLSLVQGDQFLVMAHKMRHTHATSFSWTKKNCWEHSIDFFNSRRGSYCAYSRLLDATDRKVGPRGY